MPQYSQGLWGAPRTNVGAFNFENPTSGHIGAFYLSDSIDVVQYITDPVILYLSVIDPDINVIGGSGVDISINYPRLYLTVPDVGVIVNRDIDVQILADRWCGTTPLTVNFTADVMFSKEYSSIYEIDYCYWNFDADNNINKNDYDHIVTVRGFEPKHIEYLNKGLEYVGIKIIDKPE